MILPSALFSLLVLAIDSSAQKYTVCSTTKHNEACQQLDRSNDIRCDQHHNNIGCILGIEDGKTTFGTIKAEEGLLAANLTSNVVVIGEFIGETSQQDVADYETVVIVRENQTNGLKGLKGLRYCHPGLEVDNVTPYVLKEFELAVLSSNEIDVCSADVQTLTEKHIKALAHYFGPSCRPGAWTEDDNLDKTLKNKYKTLTDLCNVSAYTKPVTQFQKSLDCLTNGNGDLALTSLNTVKLFARDNPNRTEQFRYLCPGDQTNTLDRPCSWTKQPWSLLVANKNNITELVQELSTWFADQTIAKSTAFGDQDFSGIIRLEKTYIPHLKSILEFSEMVRLNVTPPLPLQDYMRGFRTVPTFEKSKKCKAEMKWCTVSSQEKQKCQWFSQASLNYGLQPVISCVRKSDKFECLDAVENMAADIVAIEADNGYSAIRKNLSAIAFPETPDSELLRILLIAGPEVERLENLKGKSACFPVYGGIAWLSFIDIGQGIVLANDTCDYGKLISDFVGQSCMPGARDTDYGKSSGTDEEKICGLCKGHAIDANAASYCNADANNLYFGNQGALNCLQDIGDFALITIKSGELSSNNLKLPANYTILCRNGTRAKYPGLDVDKDCYLSIITTSEIVTRRDDALNEDIRLALLEFDNHFARKLGATFKLFDEFNGTKDLLFKDSTPGLDLPDSQNEGIRNYVQLFSHIDGCVSTGAGSYGSRIGNVSVFTLIIYQFLVTNV